MRIDAFPSCCGAYIISGFEYFYQDSPKIKEHNERIKQATKVWLTSTCHAYSRYAILMAIISEQQEYVNGQLLEEAGFIPVGQGINGVHNSRNTLYIKVREKGTQDKAVQLPVKSANKIRKTKFKGLEE